MIYTPKQAGVREDCNVRTDKWALAMDAMDKVNNYKLNEYLKKVETESYMVLNRVYNVNENGEITNPSTYISPKDYTYIFATNTEHL